MSASRSISFSPFGLPLLARELTELGNRRRTYVLRVVYVVLLFALAYLLFADVLSAGADPLAVLGQGRRMFEELMWLQLAGIFLFMPILGCGAIAREREQNSLELLLLTRLGPTTILLEKLLSRLVPMFAFLLLAMPLLAFAYSLGGVTEMQLLGNICLLPLVAVQVAALTLMCSAWYSSTAAALVASYVLSIVIFCLDFCCTAPFAYAVSISDFGLLVTSSVTLAGLSVVWLLLARRFLTSRTVVAPEGAAAERLNRRDRYSLRGERASGQVVLMRDAATLPDDQPVAWRESLRLLGSFEAMFPLISVITLPLLFLLVMGIIFSDSVRQFWNVAEVLLWIAVALLLIVTTTGLVSRERDRQTLDVLMATPLSGREILSQKLQPVWSVRRALWIPFGTLAAFRLLLWVKGQQPRDGYALLATLAAVLVYAPLVVWLPYLCGVLIRSRVRAMLTAVAILAAWAVLPGLVIPEEILRGGGMQLQLVGHLCRPALIFASYTDRPIELLAIGTNALFYLVLALAIRRYLFTRADRLLGRLSAENAIEPPAGTAVPSRPANETVAR